MEHINHRTGTFAVDIAGDPYGLDFWHSVESRKYEPDTVGFLEDNLSNDTVLMDIGAANGAMTIIAAQLGSRVISYEPDPRMFSILQRNINLNADLKDKVKCLNVGISTMNGSIEFSNKGDSTIFSSIVVGDNGPDGQFIEVHSLSDEIKKISVNASEKLFLKMDIEGAEWRILNDKSTLDCLKANKTTILLAVHPGFYRPHKKIAKGIDRLSITFWHLRNYFESMRTFKRISEYGQISRTNLNPVRNRHIFAILILGGYHEFVLKF